MSQHAADAENKVDEEIVGDDEAFHTLPGPSNEDVEQEEEDEEEEEPEQTVPVQMGFIEPPLYPLLAKYFPSKIGGHPVGCSGRLFPWM